MAIACILSAFNSRVTIDLSDAQKSSLLNFINSYVIASLNQVVIEVLKQRISVRVENIDFALEVEYRRVSSATMTRMTTCENSGLEQDYQFTSVSAYR